MNGSCGVAVLTDAVRRPKLKTPLAVCAENQHGTGGTAGRECGLKFRRKRRLFEGEN